MNELLNKISEYNLFNYLLPGVLYLYYIDNFLWIEVIGEDYLILIFIAYFTWLCISRFWSVVIEWGFKKYKIIKFEPYNKYLQAIKSDKKIELLSQENNVLRSIIALFIIIISTHIYLYIIHCFRLEDISEIITVILILILFILSYRKQTTYITERIKKVTK